MPAIVQQIDRLPLVEKMQLVQHLLQSLSSVFADKGFQDRWQMPQKTKRIGLMAGKWSVPSFDEDKKMDEEILGMFNLNDSDKLPLHHRDPFDRMLLAQASANGMKMMSHDRQFSAYGDFVLSV